MRGPTRITPVGRVDILGLACKQVDGSFVLDKPYARTDVELELEGYGGSNGLYVVKKVKVTWKGHAQVSCCCDKSGKVDAGGAVTSKGEFTPTEDILYGGVVTGPSITVPSPTSMLGGVGDVIGKAIENKLPSMNGGGGDDTSLQSFLNGLNPPEGTWDNNGQNPCQKLND